MTRRAPQALASMPSSPQAVATTLKRRLGLPLLVLYGTGITIGAGIYVLIGAVAGHAGAYAPWSFLLAAAIMALTVASYIELSTRFPVSAGEAAYVKVAFESRPLSILVGLLTIGIATVSSAAVALGSAGYIQQFLDWPRDLIVIAVIVLLGAVAAWGILESVVLASLFTLIEVGGLVAIIALGVYSDVPIVAALTNVPPLDVSALSGIAFGSLLAFFAFIGFEDLANVVEEAKQPRRDIPRAMILTLLISTALYVLVAAVAVSTVSIERLALSPAPLSLVFRAVAEVNPRMISLIAIVATLNTILAQMTMASRVLYGLARDGDLPNVLARVHPVTGTPVVATILIVVCVIPLALSVPFAWLAEGTSVATLVVFAFVNIALLRLRYRGVPSAESHVSVPVWVPALGVVACLAMIGSSLLG
ncbi:MAG: amino acid permease [Pseudomonadota bacterium]